MQRKKLTELEGEFVHIINRPEADVLCFICPVCEGGHSIMVSWNPPSLYEGGAVWKKTGDSLENVTIHPSINCDVPVTINGQVVPSGCKFHGWVKSGWVEW